MAVPTVVPRVTSTALLRAVMRDPSMVAPKGEMKAVIKVGMSAVMKVEKPVEMMEQK